MKKVIAIVLTVLLLSACSQQAEIDEVQPSIADYEEQISQLTQKVEIRNNRIADLTTENSRRKEAIEGLDALLNELMRSENDSVYSKGYSERSSNSLPRAMRVITSTFLRVHPYSEAAVVRGSRRAPYNLEGKDVIIHNFVRNEEKEEWVLVEYSDLTHYSWNYGYIPLDSLQEVEYTVELIDDTESIDDIQIGDAIDKAIYKWGNDYSISRGPHLVSYGFDRSKEVKGVFIGINRIKNSITSITTRVPRYKTIEGVQVGDNAKEVISLYEQKYERNIDEKLYGGRSDYIFKLNEKDFIIEFQIDCEKLTDLSVISEISIYNIYVGEW